LEKTEELARKPISFGEGRSHNLLSHIYFMKGLFEKAIAEGEKGLFPYSK